MKSSSKILIAIAISLCSLSTQASETAINLDPFDEMENKIVNKDYKKITSVLVNKKGSLVYEKYFNEGSKSHLNDVRSASKSITALLFGQAIENGLFNSEQDKVIPVFADKQPIANLTPKKANMTFQDLLMMNPPMECNDWNNMSQGNEERMYLLEDWERFVLDLPNRGTPPWEPSVEDRPYGVAYSYCTGGVFLTGSAISRKAKMGLDDFAEKYLFSPMEINKSVWPYSPMGIAQGGGGLRLSSRDYLKLGQLILDKGVYKGQSIINASWINKMLKARSLAMPDRGIEYGYLWWIFPFEHQGKQIRAYAAAGNGGNYLWVVPELELVSLVTSTAYNTSYMHQQTQEIFEKVVLKSLLD
ncbi:serine hydrolase [Kangiella sp. HZ709]|uniref:serine hydrolase domain-containing protein n=1 Tax=Kangiella sp. HZ709 TaxID=2666328 RepID=UPI0012B00325|nr:serine hydrolase [Kangiella sp. HZ709]MRX27264.1 serine hydrolase [Kangiella sp. HZ709]